MGAQIWCPSDLVGLTTVFVLAIDTATPAVTAGVVRLSDIPDTVASRVTVDARAHAELLTPHVLEVLAQARLNFTDLDAIVVGTGPGPFTGLRVGMAAAAAYGHATGLPVYPVCTLDAIAADAGGAALVVTDARRREVYWAAYGDDGTRLDGPHVETPAGLAGTSLPRAAGDGARIYADIIGLPVVEPRFPSPAGLVASAAAELQAKAEPAPLTPLYLRRPDAEPPGARKRVSR